jgi:hypothetical protein
MPQVLAFILAHFGEIYAIAKLVYQAVKQEPTKEAKVQKKKNLFCALKSTCQN